MRLCIACGTYNPVHIGHIAMWRYVLENFSYDKVLVIPSYIPPVKNSCISAEHRLNMVKLAAQEVLGVEVSEIEFEREEVSYTYNTVKELYKKYDVEGKIAFITGLDAYLTLDTWFEAEKLKDLLDFVVFERSSNAAGEKVSEMIKKGYNKIDAGMPVVEVSSSQIREKIKKGESIDGLVPDRVKEYIEKNELYNN